MNNQISNLTFILSWSFIGIAMMITLWQGLKMDKDILISAIRAFLQLFVTGYLLQFVFNAESYYLTAAVLLFMTIVAGRDASKRGKGLPHAFQIVTLSIGLGEIVTLGILLLIKVISFSPSEAIPLSGMILGNSMIAASLALERLKSSMAQRKNEVEALLALGATPRQASSNALRETLRAAIIPTVDRLKTMGIVSLPGMMSGLILAGQAPTEAVKYQIIVMFMLTLTVSVTSTAIGLFAYKGYFTNYWGLKEEVIAVGSNLDKAKK
ncbi:MAG: iron export ABC transporter permease subunit FetB [Firmicutes bacterium]|nr:iron export ABC transporter permease subunit FetB [Bacillota bacterium]MDD4263051.1 iron export ABC transporter permease subunit FetB [Bacillota bacterium]MDD4692800.1 iron export ABC transporter permease subunit FetB [Bacillota bacterium]